MPHRQCQHCRRRLEALRRSKRFCSPRCRVAAHRQRQPNRRKIFTAVRGTNATLMAKVAALYLMPGDIIADVTYGNGNFWRRLDMARYTLLASDLVTCPQAPYDLRALPYADQAVDHVVLDPPYLRGGGTGSVPSQFERVYRNLQTTPAGGLDGIMALYRAGMQEAWRVLRPGGLLWLKCQDQVDHGRQAWTHIELYDAGVQLGFQGRDLFVLVTGPRPMPYRQRYARRNHSYLWIFQKPRRSRTREAAPA